MRFELQANTQEILGHEDVESVRLADGRVFRSGLSCYGGRYWTLY